VEARLSCRFAALSRVVVARGFRPTERLIGVGSSDASPWPTSRWPRDVAHRELYGVNNLTRCNVGV
jgi:hypothetical protein